MDAPYVDEFPLVLECNLIQAMEIGLHTLFVGEIMDIKADDSILGDDGMPDIEKLKPMTFAPVGGNTMAWASSWEKHSL